MLTSKQRAYLKSLANSYDTLFQVGKGGISDALIKQVDDALTARELIKLNTLENTPETPQAIAQQIADKVDAEVVQVIGRKMIFYRRNMEKTKIMLPKQKKQ